MSIGSVPSQALAAEGGADAVVAGMAYTGSSTAVETNSANTTSARAATHYTGVVNGPGITFAFECDGQGLGATAATSLVRCYLQTSGVDYDSPTRTNLPGNVVASARTQWLDFRDIGAGVTVCAEVEVLPISGDPVAVMTCTDAGVAVPSPVDEGLTATGVTLPWGNPPPFRFCGGEDCELWHFTCAGVAYPHAVDVEIPVGGCVVREGSSIIASAPATHSGTAAAATSGTTGMILTNGSGPIDLCWVVRAYFLQGSWKEVTGCKRLWTPT